MKLVARLRDGSVKPGELDALLSQEPDLADDLVAWLREQLDRPAVGDRVAESDVRRVIGRLVDLREARVEGGVCFDEVAGRDIVHAAINVADAAVDVYRGEVRALLYETRRDLPVDHHGRPHFLLRAEHAVVPYVGREAELADLDTWCGSGRPFAARLYTGPGGAGKTRLAVELGERLRGAGWAA